VKEEQPNSGVAVRQQLSCLHDVKGDEKRDAAADSCGGCRERVVSR
jgi:hypothetical protein